MLVGADQYNFPQGDASSLRHAFGAAPNDLNGRKLKDATYEKNTIRPRVCRGTADISDLMALAHLKTRETAQ